MLVFSKAYSLTEGESLPSPRRLLETHLFTIRLLNFLRKRKNIKWPLAQEHLWENSRCGYFLSSSPLLSTHLLLEICLFIPPGVGSKCSLRNPRPQDRDVALELILTEVQQTRLIMYMLLHYLSTPHQKSIKANKLSQLFI